MIRFHLRCGNRHEFEAWFPSNAGFDEQKARGLLSCAVCGDEAVEKAPMAPQIVRSTGSAPMTIDNATGAVADAPARDTVATPSPDAVRRGIEALHRVIEARFDNVGRDFATEARAIHDGTKDPREIYGQATLDEVKDLAEDGIPVVPIPSLQPSDS